MATLAVVEGSLVAIARTTNNSSRREAVPYELRFIFSTHLVILAVHCAFVNSSSPHPEVEQVDHRQDLSFGESFLDQIPSQLSRVQDFPEQDAQMHTEVNPIG